MGGQRPPAADAHSRTYTAAGCAHAPARHRGDLRQHGCEHGNNVMGCCKLLIMWERQISPVVMGTRMPAIIGTVVANPIDNPSLPTSPLTHMPARRSLR
eukprot:gene18764-2337_t